MFAKNLLVAAVAACFKPLYAITEAPHAGGFLISESDGRRSRDNKTVASGQTLKAGHVVGAVASGAASTAYAGTGNGAITMDVTTPVLAGAKVGDYTATCTAAATNGGTFTVEDPDGYVLGNVAVGATFADDIKFVIADGATDFVVGDKFTITVAAGSGKLKELAPAANDGTQLAAGILYAAVDASAADKDGVLISRAAEVNGNELTWPSGISNGNKTKALAQLTAIGIIVR